MAGQETDVALVPKATAYRSVRKNTRKISAGLSALKSFKIYYQNSYGKVFSHF